MRIATFNLENLDHPLGHRLAVLRPALERLEADILCLQEINSQKRPGSRERHLAALDELLDGTPYADYERAATHSLRHSGPMTAHNLVTLSRSPIMETRQVWHDFVPATRMRLCSVSSATQPGSKNEPRPEGSDIPHGSALSPAGDELIDLRFDRPLLLTRIETAHGPLHVINLHLRAPLATSIPNQKQSAFTWNAIGSWAEGFYLSGLKRTGQALELRLLIDSVFQVAPDAAVLVAGDFNAEEHETAPRIVIGAPEDTGNAQLAPRSMIVLDRAIPPGKRFSVVHNGRPQMLDHMLASHSLYGRFRDIAVHNEPLGDELVGYGRGVEAAGSYHAALIATFTH